MKDRMLHFFIEFGKKNKAKAGLFGGIALLLVVGVFFVLPSFADETGDEPLAETVAEEEFEPTMEPDVTVKPLETEVPETPETEETAEPEEEKEPEESVEEEENGEETEESDPDVTPEVAAANEDAGDEPSEPVPANVGKVTSTPKKAARAVPEPMPTPTYQIVDEPVGTYTYPLNTTIQVKIEVTPPAGAGVEYQWYVSQQPNGTGEELIGHGAQTSTYTLPSNTGAGDYYYYCMIRSVDNDRFNLPSEKIRSRDVKVSIDKGEPQIGYFDLSTIKNEYYYTGEVIDPKIVCSKEGMGQAYIVVKDGGTEIRPKAESDDPYSVYLHISEGANYKGKTIDLNRTMMIKRLPTPTGPYSITGKKGKLVDGTQWYTSEVKIVPKSGFLISENGTDFQAELVYSAEGTNQGPAKSVIYLQNKTSKGITDAVTVAEKRDGKINIDQTKPMGTVSYDAASFDGIGHDYNGSYSNEEIVFNLTSSDDVSGVASCYYFWTKDILSESQLASKSWKTWADGDTQSLNTEETLILYAKVEDNAGNIRYISTDRITIDKTKPEIVCGTKTLEETKSYVADRKKITVKDAYLKQVTVRRDGTIISTKSGNDIVSGSTSFWLARPDGVTGDVTYEVTAEDEAGNEKITSITLKDPVLDVNVAPLDFGSGDNALVYGYGSVAAQAISMTNKADGKPVVVDSLELELEERAEDIFEIVDGTKIRPKQRLHVGTYTGAVRIYYNGEAESTTVCECTVTVQPAQMLVRYTGQTDVGYHTLPDLKGTIEYTQSDFKNGDTKKVFETDPNFVAPRLYYRAEDDDTPREYTSDKRAMESMQLIPDGGSSSDYIFSYRGGDLEVQQHELRNGYVIEGDKVDGYNWYISSHVAIRPANGFRLSESQDPDSFAGASQLISVEGPTNGEEKSFYVMNNTTGEISKLMKETIKIDNTAPFFREGEGIIVSSNLWTEFCNTVTFGIFFNNTKSVSIRATDEESGLESIQYCVSPVAIDGNSQDLETKLEWQEYDDGFSISPDEYERVIIYAKVTNHAGLVTYASTDGMVFDNKQPDINKVEKGKEQSIIDGKEYITEELSLKVFDQNLEEALLYEGSGMSVSGGALTITENPDHSRQAVKNIPCPEKGSKTYTVLAKDSADNNAEREFTITKPIYDIVADRLKIEETDYGYGFIPQTPVTWKNTEEANADATVSLVELSNEKDFEVRKSGDAFWIAAKKGLAYGNYTTDVTLVYNGGKKAETTCSFNVNKATLTAVFTGGDAYYHEKLGEKAEVKVTGFVRQNGVLETPETAAGYRAPTVEFDGIAEETREFTPAGGKADNYKFRYKAGLLLVERRHAHSGSDGQYTIEGKISDTGWFTSDIIIRPKQGFALSHTEEYDEPLESIVVTKDTDQGSESFYVTNETTGEIFYQSTFNYRKDCVAPVIQGIVPNAVYEENSHGVVVEDDNLFSVTVNGRPQMVEHGRTRFNLTADQETMIYVVVAADIAGNMEDMTVILNQPGSLPVTGDLAVAPDQTPAPSNEKEESTGQVKKSVKVVQGAPDTSLTTSTTKLKTAVLSGDEQQAVSNGSKANIELRVRNIDSSVPQGDKELVIANLGDYTVGKYLDITLWKKVGSKSASKVTNINSPITVTVTIPEELRNRSREFVIMRVHKGVVSVLEDQDSATNTVTFMTDRFSTYALAYKTVSSSSGAGSGAGSSTGNSTKSSTNSNTRSSVDNGSSGFLGNADLVDASPETGDTAPLVPVGITFIVALAGIIATMAVRRKSVK